MTGDESLAMLRPIVERLGEHYGSVQILVSWNEDGETRSSKTGCGDWYARQGLAHEFINSDIAQENAQQLADKLRDNDSD